MLWQGRVGAAIAGALSFWAPDIVVHVIRGKDFAGRDAMLLTWLLPLMVLLLALVDISLVGRIFNDRGKVVAVLFGIWLLGPLSMFIGASTSDGGFAMPNSGAAVIIMTVFFPIFTFMMSAYEGSLLALLIVTIGLVLFAGRRARAR
jgi:hypothetical protein